MEARPEFAELHRRALAWLTDDPDPDDRAELRSILDGLPATAADLADRFRGMLEFGTAGLRGPLRAGPNGMNTAVVRATTAGLLRYLSDKDGDGFADGPIVVGYDARHRSRAFAWETAAVATGAGRDALLLPRALPTPLLAYLVRPLDAAAGVMITASHNPPADNGYKVYLSDGGQLAPPHDVAIASHIAAVVSLSDVPLRLSDVEIISEHWIESYLEALSTLVPQVPEPSRRALTIAYTPLHGVGGELTPRALAAAGFTRLRTVAEQLTPDPDFPTVAFPNPEEPGALDLLLATARLHGAHVAIANDPDADRCAVAIPDAAAAAGWRALTGDELGILLADHLMRHGRTGTFATTIVSSTQLAALCRARGVKFAETLTGFKWIVRAAPDLAFGYEEAIGYCVAPDVVRDKDGVAAALLVAELVHELAARGLTLADRLDELAAELGIFVTGQVSVRVTALNELEVLMARLRAAPPATLAGSAVEARDLAPDSDVLIWHVTGGAAEKTRARVVIRPSGTEPKLKAYLEVFEPPTADLAAAQDRAHQRLAHLRTDVARLLG